MDGGNAGNAGAIFSELVEGFFVSNLECFDRLSMSGVRSFVMFWPVARSP
jgi:hypothetical protein